MGIFFIFRYIRMTELYFIEKDKEEGSLFEKMMRKNSFTVFTIIKYREKIYETCGTLTLFVQNINT